jgi:uncharacterized secreted protein with C-terminal beta-propeller domain
MKRKIIFITIISTLLLTGISVAKGHYSTIKVFMDQIQLRINGQLSSSPVDAMIYNGTVYLPIRTIGERMDGKVTWDGVSRTVDLDFVNPQSDSLIAAANVTIYQYIATEKNQIMTQLTSNIKNKKYQEMKEQIESLRDLEDLAVNLEDHVMMELLNKMTFSAEIIRSGLETKQLGLDYKLGTELFIESEKKLTTHIKNRLN